MSNVDQYPRVPVALEGAEAQRRDADAINYLMGRVGVIEDALILIESVSKEEAILRGSVTLSGAAPETVTNYPNSWMPGPPILSTTTPLITLDETAGTITIGYTGIYALSGYVIHTGGPNGTYVFRINSSSGGTFPLGVGSRTGLTDPIVYTASASAYLNAGEVLTLTSTSQAGAVITESNLHVTLETLDAFT